MKRELPDKDKERIVRKLLEDLFNRDLAEIATDPHMRPEQGPIPIVGELRDAIDEPKAADTGPSPEKKQGARESALGCKLPAAIDSIRIAAAGQVSSSCLRETPLAVFLHRQRRF